MATAQEILTSVEEAILALTTNRVQSVRIGDNSYTLLELDQLRRLRNELKAEVAAATRTRRCSVVTFRRPS